jgi:hypothetical protein
MRKCGKIWYKRTGHRWQYNETHALCMLDKEGYRQTHRISDTLLPFHGNNRYQKAHPYYVHTYITYRVEIWVTLLALKERF